MRSALFAAIVLALLPLAGAAQTGGNDRRWGAMGPGVRANLARHQRVLMFGVPAAYRSVRDPSPYDQNKILRGAALFQRECSACHGSSGQGNGRGASVLTTPPADLAWLARTPNSRSDPYMYWSIAEGGEPFGSDMPAFKGRLSKSEMWAVIAFVRDGMPHIG